MWYHNSLPVAQVFTGKELLEKYWFRAIQDRSIHYFPNLHPAGVVGYHDIQLLTGHLG
jgi:hypothetical protein